MGSKDDTTGLWGAQTVVKKGEKDRSDFNIKSINIRDL